MLTKIIDDGEWCESLSVETYPNGTIIIKQGYDTITIETTQAVELTKIIIDSLLQN